MRGRHVSLTYNNDEKARIQGVFKDVTLRAIDNDRGVAFLDEHMYDSESGHIAVDYQAMLHQYMGPTIALHQLFGCLFTDEKGDPLFSEEICDPLEFQHFSVVVGIDGVDVTNLPIEQTRDLLKKRSPKKKLRMMDDAFSFLFFNPAAAIDLGLLEVLQHRIEVLGMNVNSHRCWGIRFESRTVPLSPSFESHMPLVAHALAQPDSSLFHYLLSVEDIVLNPSILEAEYDRASNNFTPHRTPLLHQIHIISIEQLDGKLDISWIETLLQQRGIEVDTLDSQGKLHCVALPTNSNSRG